jgi:hypothetical protein
MHVEVEPRLFQRALTEAGSGFSRENSANSKSTMRAVHCWPAEHKNLSMPRIIVIDKTAIDQLNSDNKDLANFFNSLRSVNLSIINNAHLEMTAETYAKLNAAEQQLCKDLGVKPANSDQYSINSFRGRTDSKARFVEQWDPDAFKNIAPEHEATIALAFGSAELLTFDQKLAETYGRLTARLQDKVVPELKSMSVSNKPIEYQAARRNLGLRALNITPAGAVLPTPGYTRVKMDGKTVGWVTPDKEGFIVAEGGPRTKGGARTTKTITAVVGDHEPVQAPKEYGPSAGGDAKFQTATVALQGLNFLLQEINGTIQGRRFIAERDRLTPEIQKHLDDDPQIGAMLFVLYSKDKGDIESAIDTATVFQSIQVAYGFTPDDALREYGNRPRLTGPADVTNEIWIKPHAPLDIGRLRLPFGTTAAGLATFVPGKEKLVKVKFSGVAGFDDKTFSREELDVPAGMTPRFYYLWPPKEVRYHDFGRIKTVDIHTTISDEADESVANLGPARKLYKGVPVVKLDSFINPSTWFSDGATAAMVWPADNRTANLFQTTRATGDNNNLLAGQGIGMMRWIRPEFIRVLKDPI